MPFELLELIRDIKRVTKREGREVKIKSSDVKDIIETLKTREGYNIVNQDKEEVVFEDDRKIFHTIRISDLKDKVIKITLIHSTELPHFSLTKRIKPTEEELQKRKLSDLFFKNRKLDRTYQPSGELDTELAGKIRGKKADFTRLTLTLYEITFNHKVIDLRISPSVRTLLELLRIIENIIG